jgi:hypothetical protein
LKRGVFPLEFIKKGKISGIPAIPNEGKRRGPCAGILEAGKEY